MRSQITQAAYAAPSNRHLNTIHIAGDRNWCRFSRHKSNLCYAAMARIDITFISDKEEMVKMMTMMVVMMMIMMMMIMMVMMR